MKYLILIISLIAAPAYGAEHVSFLRLIFPVFAHQGMEMICPTMDEVKVICIDVNTQVSYNCRPLTPDEGFFDNCRRLTGV